MINDFINLQKKESQPWGFWATVGFCFIMGTVAYGIMVAVSGIEGVLKPWDNGLRLATNRLMVDPLIIVMCILFVHLRKGITFQDYLGLKRVKVSQMLIWCAIIAIVFLGMDQLENAIGYSNGKDSGLKMYKTAGCVPVLWFMTVILGPVTEETVFRGFVFKGFNAALGPVLTIILTSFIHTILHFQSGLITQIMRFIAAVLFCIARTRTGSLYVPITMHMVGNLVGMSQIWYFAQQNG
jgi:uncharacterized protein